MFGVAWAELLERIAGIEERIPEEPREALKLFARTFFEFATSDLARYQLMNQRTIAGFEPSPEAYAPSVTVLEKLTHALADLGVTRAEDVDLYVAIVGGLVDAQLANDPGGSRWERLVDRAMDMLADDVGIPSEKERP